MKFNILRFALLVWYFLVIQIIYPEVVVWTFVEPNSGFFPVSRDKPFTCLSLRFFGQTSLLIGERYSTRPATSVSFISFYSIFSSEGNPWSQDTHEIDFFFKERVLSSNFNTLESPPGPLPPFRLPASRCVSSRFSPLLDRQGTFFTVSPRRRGLFRVPFFR